MTTDYESTERSEAFQTLKRRHRRFVFPLTVAFLAWYFAYVLLAAFAPDFMGIPVFGNINIGLLLGLGQFVSTFAITMWYVWYANRHLDPLSEAIRSDLTNAETTGATK